MPEGASGGSVVSYRQEAVKTSAAASTMKASVDELLERELLPPSVFEEIAGLVTVGAPAAGANP